MLTNWTVITEATRDVMAREYYLLDTEHRNHRHTENIINLFGSAKQSLNILRNCERYKLKQAIQRRGGRPPTQSVEFVCTLPKGIRPEANQWRQILRLLMTNLACHLNVSTHQLAPIVRAVVHQQKQKTKTRGSGDHIHIIVGKFTDELNYLADLQRKSTTRLIKNTFNSAVLEVVGVDHRTYLPQKQYKGNAQKRAPSWKVKAARKGEAIKAQEQQLKRMIAQANKWLKAFEYRDQTQMKRQYNRLVKELGSMNDVNEETLPLYEFMRELVSKVEHKAKTGEHLIKILPCRRAL